MLIIIRISQFTWQVIAYCITQGVFVSTCITMPKYAEILTYYALYIHWLYIVLLIKYCNGRHNALASYFCLPGWHICTITVVFNTEILFTSTFTENFHTYICSYWQYYISINKRFQLEANLTSNVFDLCLTFTFDPLYAVITCTTIVFYCRWQWMT